MENQKVVIVLDGFNPIYIDNSVLINGNSYLDHCDRSLLDFAYDEIFDNKPIIQVSNSEGEYVFPVSKILLLKQYKEI